MTIIAANQITLHNDQQYSYSMVPFEMTNALGHTVAVLQEYTITRISEDTDFFSCRLYKTKEGNWYDINPSTPSPESNILRNLKTAIDRLEEAVAG